MKPGPQNVKDIWMPKRYCQVASADFGRSVDALNPGDEVETFPLPDRKPWNLHRLQEFPDSENLETAPTAATAPTATKSSEIATLSLLQPQETKAKV